VVDQQPNVELGAGKLSRRQRLQARRQRRARDGQRVDTVGLAALAARAPRVRHQPRRDPDHALTARDQKPLKRARDVPAVLQRPHPLAIETTRPLQHLIKPAGTDGNRLVAERLTRRRHHAGDGV
jgi:hypothetical protein